MHCDSDPGAPKLGEAVQAALFTHHPYGIPVIGWGHEIEGLSARMLSPYRRFYTPENAIQAVAGDRRAGGRRALAEETYGKIVPVFFKADTGGPDGSRRLGQPVGDGRRR